MGDFSKFSSLVNPEWHYSFSLKLSNITLVHKGGSCDDNSKTVGKNFYPT